jgi:hypothetical protein
VANLYDLVCKPVVTITATDADADETGQDPGTFLVSRSIPSGAITVNLDISASTAGASDYTSSPDISGGTLTMDDGVDQVEIVITPEDDTVYLEAPEDVIVTITTGTGYVVGTPDTATVTIQDYTPDAPGSFDQTSPIDGYTDGGLTPTLRWEASANALDYTVTVYSDPSMVTVVHTEANVTITRYDVPSAAGLAYDTQYWWKVTAVNVVTSVDAANAGLGFWTSPDGPPQVASTDPSSGDDDADIGADIIITFNETMDPSTVTSPAPGRVTMTTGGANVPGLTTFYGNRIAIFNPNDDLEYETTYTVTVASTVEDMASNQLGGAGYMFTFTTQGPLTGLAEGEGCLPVRVRTQTGVSGGTGLAGVALCLLIGCCTLRRFLWLGAR